MCRIILLTAMNKETSNMIEINVKLSPLRGPTSLHSFFFCCFTVS